MIRLGVLVSGNLGGVVLEHLAENHQLAFVMTDKGSNNIRTICLKRNIPVFIGNPRGGKAVEFLKGKSVDILISANYLYIIEKDIIEHPKKFAFNVHGSLLPKYRGRTPHVWAIINNEKETGITAHIIDEGCDTGDILEQIIVPIDSDDTGGDVLVKYSKLYIPLIDKVLFRTINGTLDAHKQEPEEATYFDKRSPEDGKIDWSWQKERIRNWVRAQSLPYPGAFNHCEGNKIIIDEVQFSEKGYRSDMPNGLVISDTPFLVKSPNGVIQITKNRNDYIPRPGQILN